MTPQDQLTKNPNPSPIGANLYENRRLSSLRRTPSIASVYGVILKTSAKALVIHLNSTVAPEKILYATYTQAILFPTELPATAGFSVAVVRKSKEEIHISGAADSLSR